MAGSTPSRRTRTSATASVGGVRSDRWRQRERIVGSTSSTAGAHSSQTVCGVGSSIALSRALPAGSVSRSASSTTMTCHRPPEGCRAARETRARASGTPIESLRVLTTSTSAWVPASTVWHAGHSPQPPRGHCNAAAKARAAVDRPEPGGPVTSQACVMPVPGSPRRPASAAAAARRRTATAGCCPTRSAQTPGARSLTGPRAGARPGASGWCSCRRRRRRRCRTARRSGSGAGWRGRRRPRRRRRTARGAGAPPPGPAGAPPSRGDAPRRAARAAGRAPRGPAPPRPRRGQPAWPAPRRRPPPAPGAARPARRPRQPPAPAVPRPRRPPCEPVPRPRREPAPPPAGGPPGRSAGAAPLPRGPARPHAAAARSVAGPARAGPGSLR